MHPNTPPRELPAQTVLAVEHARSSHHTQGVFLQHAHRINFECVTVRNYNGDGFSFQVCDDIVSYG
jgi:hypothetical protein